MKREQAHPEEIQLGRITTAGGWDLRYRAPCRTCGQPHARPTHQAAPAETPPSWLGIIGLAAYLIIIFGSVIFVGAVVAAASYAQVTP